MKSLNLTFSPSFKRAADTVAEDLGLENITSERQKANGTICYHDPETDVDYTMHETGYIRRRWNIRTWGGLGKSTTYQLNPQKEAVGYWTDSRTGKRTSYVCRERVALDQWGQLGKLCTSVISYRQNN